MKIEQNILIAFLLNLFFSIFEFWGGIFTGSVAIISDAVHDAGDASSIGISYLLERKSRKQPDERYTFGYARYSIMGGFITTIVLIIGSIVIICNAVLRIITPVEINYNSMIVFAIVGTCVNLCAALVTRHGDSLNQKAVNLHMLEDVLGWIIVLVGAIVMRFTDCALIDPLMSIGVSLFILFGAIGNFKEIIDVFLEKAPCSIDVSMIKKRIEEIDGVLGVHNLYIWSLDEKTHCAMIHVVTNSEPGKIRESVRNELNVFGIRHMTVETESDNIESQNTGDCSSV